MSPNRFLRIYLNDHLAVATAGLELAKRCSSNNKGTDLGKFLESLVQESARDRDTLKRVMHALRLRPSRVKGAAAWTAEKLGRLKPNGRLRGYSALSRVIELEALYALAQTRVLLWRNVTWLADRDARLGSTDFGELVERGRRQLSEIDDHRRSATARAFGMDE